MAVKADGKGGVAPENPLVPNRVLREMYRKLVEARLIEDHEAKGKKSRRTSANVACKVSLSQGIGEGDLVMDSQPGGLMKYLLGIKLTEAFPSPKAKKNKPLTPAVKPSTTRVLPFVQDSDARLFAALGVGMLQKKMKGTDLTVVFVSQDETSPDTWRRALTFAAANKLPVIFVALPDPKGRHIKSKNRASEIALRCGLPGIPVEATDVVALYRVVQEAVVRIRIGGGGVVIEAIPFQLDGERQSEAGDSILQMGELLLRRKIATTAWMSSLELSFRRRLEPPARA